MTSILPDADARDDDGASRLVLVIDAAVPMHVQQACAELAAELADRVGMSVTLTAIPRHSLSALRPALSHPEESRRSEFTPSRLSPPMSSAPFVWREDGRPDWAAMWSTFCELALYGGPPHRGASNPLRAPDPGAEMHAADMEMLEEIRRGIRETTGLAAAPGDPGWLAVTCPSRQMAAWLGAAIVLENVEARVEGERLLLPAGPGYRLKDEVKSIITVMAKTHHHWVEHIATRTAAGEEV